MIRFRRLQRKCEEEGHQAEELSEDSTSGQGFASLGGYLQDSLGDSPGTVRAAVHDAGCIMQVARFRLGDSHRPNHL